MSTSVHEAPLTCLWVRQASTPPDLSPPSSSGQPYRDVAVVTLTGEGMVRRARTERPFNVRETAI
jgi:hypothetical protein